MSSLNTPSNLRLALPWALLICLGIAAFQLWQDQFALQKTLTSSQQELTQITALSLEYQSLGGTTKTDRQRFTEVSQAIVWLTNSSKRQGIGTKISEVEGDQKTQLLGSQIDVIVKQAHFNRLIQWMQQQETTNLALISSQFAAADSGKVTGFIRFEVR